MPAKYKILFPLSLVLLIAAFVHMDRYFFKKNGSFSIHHLYSTLPLSSHAAPCLPLLKQPFIYLTKGHQTYVFLSNDKKFVLKIYKFPSHFQKIELGKAPFCLPFR